MQLTQPEVIQQKKRSILIVGSEADFSSKVKERIEPGLLCVFDEWIENQDDLLSHFKSPPEVILLDGRLSLEVEEEIERVCVENGCLLIVLDSDHRVGERDPILGDRKFHFSVQDLPQVMPLILSQAKLVRAAWVEEYPRPGSLGLETPLQVQNQDGPEAIELLKYKETVLEQLPVGILLIDIQGKITWVNSFFSTITGLAKEKILEQTPGFIYRNSQNNLLVDRFWRKAFSGESWQDRIGYLPENGSRRIHQLEISPIKDNHGTITHFIALVQDVGEEPRSTTSLSNAEEQYRHIFERTPIFLASLHNDYLIYINQTGAHLLGFSSAEELLGRPWAEYIPKDVIDSCLRKAQLDRDVIDQELVNTEMPIQRSDGEQILLNITVLSETSAGEEIIHIVGQDITEQKRAQVFLHHQSALSKVELAINQSMELEKVLGQVTEFAAQASSVRIGSVVFLADAEKKVFKLSSTYLPGVESKGLVELTEDQSLAVQWILEHKQPLIVQDLETSPFRDDLTISVGIGSAFGMPLLVDDDLVGILFVLDDRVREFEPEDIEYITALANRAALAIAKLNLYKSLQAAKNVAEQAAKNRANYLASMSHELRAPLAAINNLSELMSGTNLTSVQSEYLALIKSSADRLLALMNDVLDYSRLEASKLGLVERQFSLIQLVENALDLAAIPAAQKGLDLAYRIDEDVPDTLLGDANRLSQVLTNLLTNAIKFTENGNIFVEIRQCAEKIALVSMVDSEVELQFSVYDTGIGISKAEQKDLFKPFSQVDMPKRSVQSGSGLGLAICKQLVQLMNGDIWVTSKGRPGEGSTFTFSVRMKLVFTSTPPFLQMEQPYLRDKKVALIGPPKLSWQMLANRLEFWGMSIKSFEDPGAAANWLSGGPQVDMVILDVNSLSPVDDESLVDSIIFMREIQSLPVIAYIHPNTLMRDVWKRVTTNILRRPISLPRLYRCLVDAVQFSGAATRPQSNVPDLEILLVDDDLVNVAAAQMQLERLGSTADTASNGVEAMQALAKKQFDLVIMDMRMDAMDGHATTRAIRQTIPPEKQPLIAILTAGVTPNQLNALQSAGIDAYLEKPITIDRLLHLLELVRRKEDAGYVPIIVSGNPGLDQKEDQPASGLDQKVLQDLLRLADSTENRQALRILDLYFQTTPNLMKQVKLAARVGQVDRLKNGLHALRGSCEIFGAIRLSQLCKACERDLLNDGLENLDDRVAVIQAEYELVTEQLQAYRAANKG